MNNNTINSEVTMGGASGTLLAGRYRVVKQLGQGGMGSVWLAEDMKLDGFKVAIKMLPSVLVNNKRAYRQVKAEALVSLKLVHQNIVPVRAFEEENGTPFLVMDYIDGQTLDDYLAEKGRLTEDETVKLLKPVAAALDYAHSQGVVHRDVKPGNVMIRKDGVPFVLDFGIAREIQETMTRVTGKLSSGTLMYMSPEQLNGAAPNSAQDIYSFSAMVYECLTGAPPFSRGQIEYQIVNNKPESLPCDIAIRLSVMAGLEKTPEVRPATSAAVLAEQREGGECIAEQQPVAVRLELEPTNVKAIRVEDYDAETSRPSVAGCTDVRRACDGGESKTAVLSEPEIGSSAAIVLPGGTEMRFNWCPATTSEAWKRISGGKTYFMMGSPKGEGNPEEMLHRVVLTRGFWIGKFAVTQRQWCDVMGTNPARIKGQDHPVEQVSWDECQEFVKRVNGLGRASVSLPTEAQWEYACRAGTSTPFGFADAETAAVVNCGDQAFPGAKVIASWNFGTMPVGRCAPNPWGLYDMHGNVWEWCQDCYDDSFYGKSPIEDPVCDFGSFRVCRGGGWCNDLQDCRAAYRGRFNPSARTFNLGLRLVCVGLQQENASDDFRSVCCESVVQG